MTARRLRQLGALGAAWFTALALAGCGALPGDSEDDGAGAADFTGCIVSDDGGFDDRSFNQSSSEGLRAAQARRGIRTSRAESQAETDFELNLTSMAQQGCDLTVSVGLLLADATRKVARAHPDMHFVIVDDDSVTEANVKPIVYDTAEAAFLAGYLAAGTSETGKVATYGGMDVPTVRVFMDGFSDGVKYYNEKKKKDVEVLGWVKDTQRGTFLSSFQDSSRARTVAEDLIHDGADVVLPVAGQAARGAVDAVEEANGRGKQVRLIWPDTDGYESLDSGREFVLTSVVKDMARSVEGVVNQAVDGTFDNRRYVGTLQNGGVGLAPYHEQRGAVDAGLDREVRQLEQDVIDRRVAATSSSAPRS